jgi:hypothetical protein
MATLKQKKLVKKIAENLRKGKKAKPLGKIMREVGYSDHQSEHPKQITESKGFVALMEAAGITDDKLASKLREGLDATKVISCNVIAKDGEGMKDANSMTKDFVDVPDYPTQHKFLETALELKSHKKNPDENAGRPIMVMPVIIIDGKQKTFDIGDKK